MRENITQRFPFSNRGLVQKVDENLLADDQYTFLLNLVSFQEGTVRPRKGWEKLSIDWNSSQPSAIHSIGLGRLDGPQGDLYAYLGSGTDIKRAVYDGAGNDAVTIASGAVASPRRGTYTIYRNDKAGDNLMAYLATGEAMLRDNGSYTDARVWGIDPPLMPAVSAPGPYTFKNLIKSGTYSASPAISLTNARANQNCTLVQLVDGGAAGGYYQFTPPTLSAFLPGMYIKVGSQDAFVDRVDAAGGVFYAYLASTPSGTETVEAYQSVDISNTTGSATDVDSDAISVDLAFNGSSEDGFDTPDNIHLSLYVGTPTTIQDIRFRILTGSSSSDYYEKSLLPSPAQVLQTDATTVGSSTTAADAGDEYGRLQATNVYGQLENLQTEPDSARNPYIPPPDNVSQGLQPSQLAPASGGTWNEFDIPKSQFLKVGRAGKSGFTWADVTAIQIIVKPTDASATATIKIGSIFAYGGSGLNASPFSALSPYDYVYTYIDPETQAESNPCPIQSGFYSGLSVKQQSAIILVLGTENSGQYEGTSKIALYRKGGAFTDGLYRFIGYTSNPGPGSTTTIIDSIDDASIAISKTASFDNYPPVLADLPFLIDATITSVASSGSYGDYTLTLSLPSFLASLSGYVTAGTPLTLRPNLDSQIDEIQTFVSDIPASNQIRAFFQRLPVAGESIILETTNRSGCDVACYAFDRMLLAGDQWNPGKLYSSKTGRPESFPVINEVSGNSHVINVSSPDNPINGMCEFNGEVVILCQNSIYTATMSNGVIRVQKSPASRGLYVKGAWCEVDGEIWFLSYDGVYAWSGNQVTKKSLAIDPLFLGETVNGIAPIEYEGSFGGMLNISYFTLAPKGNEVWMNYMNTDGYLSMIRYHTLFDRWSIEEYYDPLSTETVSRNGNSLPVCSVTTMALDKTAGELVACISVSQSGPTTVAHLAYMDKLATDKSASGQSIYYQGDTKSLDMGMSMQQKHFTDIAAEITIGSTSDDFFLKAYYDYSTTASAADTFDVNPSATGRNIFQFPLGQSGSPSVSAGQEARVAKWEFYGLSTSLSNAWHNLALSFYPLADLQKGRITDWSDLGHPFDKRMKTVTLEYNVGSSTVDLYLDYVYSKDGDTYNLAAQTLTLGGGSGTAWAKQTFPIDTDIVAKMVRLRPKVATAQYQIRGEPLWDYEKYPADTVKFTDYSDYGYKYEKRFYVLYINADTNGQNVTVVIEGDGSTLQTITVNGTASNRMIPQAITIDTIAKLVRLKVTNIPTGGKFQLFDHKFEYEELPPPIVLSTPWDNHGYEYDKYFEQVNFVVNTNGQTVPVKIYGDGSLKQTVNVNTTYATRDVNITVNPSMTCRETRVEVDSTQIPVGGRFQLWSYRPIFVPSDKGRVTHTYDWTDAGHPYDKKFTEMVFEYDTDADTVQIAVDTLTGIDGNVATSAVKTFNISTGTTPARGKAVIPMTDNSGNEIIAKMVRVRTTGVSGGGTNNPDFKMWNVQFPGLITYPPDKVPFTDWSDLGWSCDKVFRGVGLEIDTGGVAATAYLDVDGTTSADSWSVNTTTSNRRVFLTPHNSTEIIGKMFRLRIVAGSGGKSQLFGQPNWDTVKDACEFLFFDTFLQAFGSVGYTVIKEIWLDRKCAGTFTLKVYDEDDNLFWTEIIPASTSRTPYRFFLPSYNGSVLNKSKKHRVTLEADSDSNPFRIYADSSRFIVVNLSQDQREGYYQNILWQDIKIAV